MSLPDDRSFAGLRVAAFESRMAGPMAELIARQGGVPLVAPSLRELPLDDNSEALAFAERLMAGQFDMVIFLTGVGTRYLAQIIETRIPRASWTAALARAEVVARGPKPVAALRELGVRVDVQIPEPNTWNELLATLDDRRSLLGTRIAVQEYGKPNPELVAGLRQRGAEVTRVPVYRWALPEDTGPLRHAAAELAAGRIGAALFTSAQQIAHLFQVAAEEGIGEALREALSARVVIGSIGPTTTEALMEHGLVADIEPEHPKMGHLVLAVAAGWSRVDKPVPRGAFEGGGTTRVEPVAPAGAPADPGERLRQSRFLRACRGEPTDVTPIWLMRQAGRYMAEYRELRSRFRFLDLCKRPELAAEVTVTAAESLGVDAAILFADILLILEPLGFELDFVRGDGPVIHNPIHEPADVDRVRPLESLTDLQYVLEAVRLVRDSLRADLPLIGFAGAPFTLACYAIEGSGSRHYEKAKAFMYGHPEAWNALMDTLTASTAAYLNAQIAAGAQAVQVFDSWVGNLSPDDYRRFVQPHMARLFAALAPGVPTIHFGTGTASLLELQRDAGGQVIGLDWRVDLDAAWDRLGPHVAVQGNLDPVVLLAPPEEIRRQAGRILAQARGRGGHIFNLGHGVLPSTPVESVRLLVDFVHEHGGPNRPVRVP
jgi:uroporphyrinogen decarboxylase